MKFEATEILSQIDELTGCESLVVAYSGGVDSSVLLHALAALRDSGRLRYSLRALHVNHGLRPVAGQWQEFCEQTCQRLGVPLRSVSARVSRIPGHSPEEQARKARYQVFKQQLKRGDCLVMAHHQDDEMENLMLRLGRGSGPGGLAGIPRRRTLGDAELLRPLLGFSRESLTQYAAQQGLDWIEDDSNTDTDFDRNFWRHDILPLIGRRFPGYRESWSKSMTLCREADQLLVALASADLAVLATDDPAILDTVPLRDFSEPRQRNVLRYWMTVLGFEPPGWQMMRRLTCEVLTSGKPGARLDCPAGSVRLFGDRLVLLGAGADSDPALDQQRICFDAGRDRVMALDSNGELRISVSAAAETSSARQRVVGGLGRLEVRYRHDGERCRLAGRPAKTVKKILQDSALPPWLRSRQPLVYSAGKLVCIPGIGVCQDFLAAADQPGMEITWRVPDLLFRCD